MTPAPDHTTQPDLHILPGGDGAPLRFRGLGQVADLDVDLTGADRPAAVSAVLVNCADASAVSEDVIWGLTLAARIGGLLSIWAADGAPETLDLQQICPTADCGADLEIALPVTALMDLAHEAEAEQTHTTGGLKLRRPTGRDQRIWLGAKNAAAPETTILASLATGELPTDPDGLAALNDSLAEFDPLPCFVVAVTCPECGHAHSLPVDLEAELLARLARTQARLFAEVDVLAQRYGWTDTDILAMPARRRARYLQIARQEEGWL